MTTPLTRQQRRLLTFLDREKAHRSRIEAVLFSYHNGAPRQVVTDLLTSVLDAGWVRAVAWGESIAYELTDAGRSALASPQPVRAGLVPAPADGGSRP